MVGTAWVGPLMHFGIPRRWLSTYSRASPARSRHEPGRAARQGRVNADLKVGAAAPDRCGQVPFRATSCPTVPGNPRPFRARSFVFSNILGSLLEFLFSLTRPSINGHPLIMREGRESGGRSQPSPLGRGWSRRAGPGEGAWPATGLFSMPNHAEAPSPQSPPRPARRVPRVHYIRSLS